MQTMRGTTLIVAVALVALGLAMRTSHEAVVHGEHLSHLVIAAIAAALAAFLVGRALSGSINR
jgi:hypothetical protein